MTTVPPGNRALILKLMVGAIVSTVAIVGVIVFFVLDGTDSDANLIVISGLLVAVVLAAAFADRHWSRLEPVAIDDANPSATAHERLIAHTVVKFSIIEAVFIAAVVMAFFTGEGWPVATTAIASIVAILVTAWPSARNIRRATSRLESRGARTGLLAEFSA